MKHGGGESKHTFYFERRHHEVLEWTYNEYNHICQHYLFIKTEATCFDQTFDHPQVCGRLSHWCCVHIGIPICLIVVRYIKSGKYLYFGWIKCIAYMYDKNTNPPFKHFIINVRYTFYPAKNRYLPDFMHSYDCQNILGSQYTHSTNDLVCHRPEDDLMLGQNM